tara:strand:- start:340 stop:927 length:588 start_codon:yes stop_codon:yes gene_type:complete
MHAGLPTLDQNQNASGVGLHAVNPSVKRFPLHLIATQGQLQIHTASYRGSFSKVLSESLRAAGLGSNVLIAQFLKGGVEQGPNKGTILCDKLHWIRPNLSCCLTKRKKEFDKNQQSEIQKSIEAIWETCKEQLFTKSINRLVLDEICLATELGYIKESDLISTLEGRPATTDVILTGPSISSKIIEMADQVTELR